MKIFALYDKVAKKFISTTLAETEEMFVRTSLFAITMDYPIRDVELYCVGLFDQDLGLIKPCTPRIVSWDCYKFPISRMEKERFLTIEQIEEAAKAKKHEFIKKQKDNLKDLERTLSMTKARLKLEEEKPKKDKNAIKELREVIKEISSEIKNLKEVL